MLSTDSLRAYQALCSFCSWGLFSDPAADEMTGLIAERDLFLDEPFSVVAQEPAARLHAQLEAFAAGGCLEDALREIRLDRTYLFFMIGSSRTSPYESVYRTDDATMFGPTTLEVRDFYRKHGLAFERNASEPDDHIGIEFAFLAHLLDLAAQAVDAGDSRRADDLLADVSRFLSEHVLVFAPIYLANVSRRAASEFYGSIAGIAACTLDALAGSVGAEPVEQVDARRYVVE